MPQRIIVTTIIMLMVLLAAGCTEQQTTVHDPVNHPYMPNQGVKSRSISFENPTGEKGAGGTAASNLGPTRKGAPFKMIKPGEEQVLCDIEGPGVIRRIWMTIPPNKPWTYRGCVVRAWWDGQEHPSIECPLGDFMGFLHGKVKKYGSAAHSLSRTGGMTIWLPMPFTENAKITFTNENDIDIQLYYQIEYTVGDDLPDDVYRLHTLFRRENPTEAGVDFELLPRRFGRGRYLGAVYGVRVLPQELRGGVGEGEVKIYLDGDRDLPTICGTGSEDYAGLAWAYHEAAFPYHGIMLSERNFTTLYRWHLPDPVYWEEDCRVTIQLIGWKPGHGLFNRSDDFCASTFWYEPIPSDPLPEFPTLEERQANIWEEPEEE